MADSADRLSIEPEKDLLRSEKITEPDLTVIKQPSDYAVTTDPLPTEDNPTALSTPPDVTDPEVISDVPEITDPLPPPPSPSEIEKGRAVFSNRGTEAEEKSKLPSLDIALKSFATSRAELDRKIKDELIPSFCEVFGDEKMDDLNSDTKSLAPVLSSLSGEERVKLDRAVSNAKSLIWQLAGDDFSQRRGCDTVMSLSIDQGEQIHELSKSIAELQSTLKDFNQREQKQTSANLTV